MTQMNADSNNIYNSNIINFLLSFLRFPSALICVICGSIPSISSRIPSTSSGERSCGSLETPAGVVCNEALWRSGIATGRGESMKAMRGMGPLFLVLVCGVRAGAGVGDPTGKTDPPWYPGELACSTFERLAATQAEVYRRVTGAPPATDEER